MLMASEAMGQSSHGIHEVKVVVVGNGPSGADGSYGPGFHDGSVTCVEVRYDRKWAVPHVVVGSGPAGGSWQDMSQGLVTLSPGYWMELPGMRLKDYLSEVKGDLQYATERAPRRIMSEYYEEFATRMLGSYLQHAKVVRLQAGKAVHSIGQEGRWVVHCMDPDSGIPVTYQAASVILAGGMFSRPKTLGLPKELDLPVVTHRQPKSWDRMGSDPPTVLVVGAGLSASDCIVQAMHHRWKVVHVFRTPAMDTNICKKFASYHPMYEEYFTLCQLMRGLEQSEAYKRFAECELKAVGEEGQCTIASVRTSASSTVQVDRVAILIGSTPDLQFLDPELQAIIGDGVQAIADPIRATPKESTHPVHVNVDPWTMCLRPRDNATCLAPDGPSLQGLYAVGPMRGDNFVRFLVGDVWGIVWHMRGAAPGK